MFKKTGMKIASSTAAVLMFAAFTTASAEAASAVDVRASSRQVVGNPAPQTHHTTTRPIHSETPMAVRVTADASHGPRDNSCTGHVDGSVEAT